MARAERGRERTVNPSRRVASRRRTDAVAQALLERGSDLVVVQSVEGELLYVNEVARTILGHEPGDMIGRSALDYVHPDDVELVSEAHARLVERGGAGPGAEMRVRHADGSWRLVDIRGTNLLDDPDVGGILLIGRDVTERRETEHALRLSEQRFEALIEHSWDVITVLDADGTWRYSSPGGTRLLGWEAGFDPEGGILSLVHPDDVEFATVALAEGISGRRGPDQPILFRVRGTNGEYRWFETIGQNLLDDPSVRGIVLNSRDITDRLEAEQALGERERELERLAAVRDRQRLELELERARRFESIGRLAGGVAHDVNTLVGIILLYFKTLDAEFEKSPKLAHDAERVRQAVERVRALTRQLLEFGRRSDAPPDVFDPEGALESVRDLVCTGAEHKVTFVLVPPDTPLFVRVRMSSFEQIFLNVLTNACDAMPDGGTVTVSTRAEDVEEGAKPGLAPGPYVVIAVADTGIGMAPEVAAAAFEPFVTTRADVDGTGLGLAIVQRLAQDSGGIAELTSERDRGTIVTIYLPRAEGGVG